MLASSGLLLLLYRRRHGVSEVDLKSDARTRFGCGLKGTTMGWADERVDQRRRAGREMRQTHTHAAH